MAEPAEVIFDRLSSMLPDFDIEGLGLDDVSFDFVTATYTITFSYLDKRFLLRLVEEKINALIGGDKFAFRRLKNLLRERCGVDAD